MTLKINIIGIGKSLPKKKVLSSELDQTLCLEEGTIERSTGLKERYFLGDECAESLQRAAIDEALSDACIQVDEIDCIINASATLQQAIPYNAAQTHQLLHLKKPIPSFDVNMTCLSVLRAFDLAARLVNEYPTILIVSCDIASVGLDWRNIRTAGLFGDGASAMLVRSSTSGGLICSGFETHSQAYDYCRIQGGGARNHPSQYQGDYKESCYFEMKGRALFKLCSQVLPPFIEKTLEKQNMCLDDVDWFVPHQASQLALHHMMALLHVEKERFIDIFKTHGNQVASSLPIAMHHLMRSGKLKAGHKVMMLGTSAGVGLGLVIWEVPS